MQSLGFVGDSGSWATALFSRCDLGDARRTRRVIEYAAQQAEDPAGSTNAVCLGDDAAAEGAYRMIRNRHIEATALEEGPFALAAEQCAHREVVLAIQDSTTLVISTALADSLGEIGKDRSGGRGMLVHSTLAVDASTGEPIGLLDQLRWQRPEQRPGKGARRERTYETKESFKWQTACERVCSRIGRAENLITVCDREADIFEFLQYQTEQAQRFIVRAAQDRALDVEGDRLGEYLSQQPVCGRYAVQISQRGAQRGHRGRSARSARTVEMEVRTGEVTLLPPKARGSAGEPITSQFPSFSHSSPMPRRTSPLLHG